MAESAHSLSPPSPLPAVLKQYGTRHPGTLGEGGLEPAFILADCGFSEPLIFLTGSSLVLSLMLV